MRSTLHPPRVGLRIGESTLSAIPVRLQGDRASLLYEGSIPSAEGDTRLVLSWESGEITELDARVRSIETDIPVVDLELHAVQGAWVPFLRYLAGEAA